MSAVAYGGRISRAISDRQIGVPGYPTAELRWAIAFNFSHRFVLNFPARGQLNAHVARYTYRRFCSSIPPPRAYPLTLRRLDNGDTLPGAKSRKPLRFRGSMPRHGNGQTRQKRERSAVALERPQPHPEARLCRVVLHSSARHRYIENVDKRLSAPAWTLDLMGRASVAHASAFFDAYGDSSPLSPRSPLAKRFNAIDERLLSPNLRYIAVFSRLSALSLLMMTSVPLDRAIACST